MVKEKLIAAGGNGYDCEGCCSRLSPPDAVSNGGGSGKPPSSRTNPSKQGAKGRLLLMLGKPSGVLVYQLKRLQARRKNSATVEFLVELDIAPFFWQDPEVRKRRGESTIFKMFRSRCSGRLSYREKGSVGVVLRVV